MEAMERRRSSGTEMLHQAAKWEHEMHEAMVEKARLWREARWRPRSLENRFMIDLGPLHDVSFWVGAPGTQQELISCHKLMLARCSSYFSELFFGGAEVFSYDNEAPLCVPDIEPRAFDAVIDYVYSGEIHLIDLSIAFDVFHAALKYRLEELASIIRPFIWSRLYPANVWNGLQFFLSHGETPLYEATLQILQRKTSRILEHPNFEEIPIALLEILLLQDKLTIESELEILTACVRWARAEALRRGIDNHEPSVLRQILSPILKHLRYLALSPDDLNDIGDEELVYIVGQVLADNYAEKGDFQLVNRTPPNYESFYAFGLVDEYFERHIVEEYFENTYDVFSIAFTSSGDFISTQLGVQVPTQIPPENCKNDTYDEDMTVLLFDFNAKKMLSVTRFTETVKYNSVIDVPFIKRAKLDQMRVKKVVKVIFHKDGLYPSNYKPENGENTELKCCNFDNVKNVKMWHRKSFSYIRFCAYSIDESEQDEL